MLHVLQGADAAGGQGPGAWVESGTGGNANQAAILQLIRILDDFHPAFQLEIKFLLGFIRIIRIVIG